jgi:hypothetical protein
MSRAVIYERFGGPDVLELREVPEPISPIAAGPNPPGGVRATGGAEADLHDLERITNAILAGKITHARLAAARANDQLAGALPA